MRLIDADALIENLRTWDDTGIARLLIEVICGAINDRPEAVVRCKDCIINDENHCLHWSARVIADGYCFMGERRTDE